MFRTLCVALLFVSSVHAQDIRDSRGNLVGRYSQQGSETILRDAHGTLLGRTFHNTTYDAHGNKVGDRNMIGTLIPPCAPSDSKCKAPR